MGNEPKNEAKRNTFEPALGALYEPTEHHLLDGDETHLCARVRPIVHLASPRRAAAAAARRTARFTAPLSPRRSAPVALRIYFRKFARETSPA